MKEWIKPIKRWGACQDALDWSEQFDTLDEAWQACGRGNWIKPKIRILILKEGTD